MNNSQSSSRYCSCCEAGGWCFLAPRVLTPSCQQLNCLSPVKPGGTKSTNGGKKTNNGSRKLASLSFPSTPSSISPSWMWNETGESKQTAVEFHAALINMIWWDLSQPVGRFCSCLHLNVRVRVCCLQWWRYLSYANREVTVGVCGVVMMSLTGW